LVIVGFFFRSIASSVTSGTSERILEGQVAIITGSGQGIGAAAAKLFAQQGAKVVVTDLDAGKRALCWSVGELTEQIVARAEGVVSEIRKAGGQAISVPGDVTAPEYPDKLLQETIKYSTNQEFNS
jgi:3-oxoacyl-[acyl-carrier protein] reductase